MPRKQQPLQQVRTSSCVKSLASTQAILLNEQAYIHHVRNAGPSGEPWELGQPTSSGRGEPSLPCRGAEHTWDAHGSPSHSQQGMECMPYAEPMAESPVPSQGQHAADLAIAGDAADRSDTDMDEPGVLPQPPLGTALPAEEDEFLEELQPDEAVGYGNVSSSIDTEEEELDDEGNDWSASVSCTLIGITMQPY